MSFSNKAHNSLGIRYPVASSLCQGITDDHLELSVHTHMADRTLYFATARFNFQANVSEKPIHDAQTILTEYALRSTPLVPTSTRSWYMTERLFSQKQYSEATDLAIAFAKRENLPVFITLPYSNDATKLLSLWSPAGWSPKIA